MQITYEPINNDVGYYVLRFMNDRVSVELMENQPITIYLHFKNISVWKVGGRLIAVDLDNPEMVPTIITKYRPESFEVIWTASTVQDICNPITYKEALKILEIIRLQYSDEIGVNVEVVENAHSKYLEQKA